MGKITQTITTQVTASDLRSDGYKVPINAARNNFDDTICFECKKSKEPNGSSLTLCKNLGPCPASTPSPNPGGTPPSPNPGGTPPSPNPGGTPPSPPARQKSGRELKKEKLNLGKSGVNSTVNQQFRDVVDYLKGIPCGRVWPLIFVQREPNSQYEDERIVFFADSQTGRKNIPLPIEERGGKWGFIDPPSSGSWQEFSDSNWCTNKVNEGLKDVLKENEMENSIPEKIDEKLKEFNFYTANDKGKQKVVFTDKDREEINKEFMDLMKKYPEDIAFIRSVVVAKGEDKKTGEPVVRLGSYYNNANIELPFNSQMNGLGKLLDGGIIYFTITNNEGPDYRDFKIVGGDKIPEVEFGGGEKEEIQRDSYINTHNQSMKKEQPFEEVMKGKEKKGLQSLLNGEGLTNEFTKSQKEFLENLKKKGFKLKKPENSDIYERVRVNSKEFTESINAWKPKEK
jgi:hypothetical protein